jgi:hypothetical protein
MGKLGDIATIGAIGVVVYVGYKIISGLGGFFGGIGSFLGGVAQGAGEVVGAVAEGVTTLATPPVPTVLDRLTSPDVPKPEGFKPLVTQGREPLLTTGLIPRLSDLLTFRPESEPDPDPSWKLIQSVPELTVAAPTSYADPVEMWRRMGII